MHPQDIRQGLQGLHHQPVRAVGDGHMTQSVRRIVRHFKEVDEHPRRIVGLDVEPDVEPLALVQGDEVGARRDFAGVQVADFLVGGFDGERGIDRLRAGGNPGPAQRRAVEPRTPECVQVLVIRRLRQVLHAAHDTLFGATGQYQQAGAKREE